MSETARHYEREQELIESFEWHGCHLVPHLRRQLALLWNSETTVERRLARILDSREGGYAILEFDRGLLSLIQTAPDAYSAYLWLRNSGELVPTFRFFLNVCGAAGRLATDVLERESQVVQVQRQGLGRRACRDCWLDWIGGEPLSLPIGIRQLLGIRQLRKHGQPSWSTRIWRRTLSRPSLPKASQSSSVVASLTSGALYCGDRRLS